MKVAVIGVLGGYLVKAGDPAGGRDLIEQSRRAALALPDAEARAFALPGLVRSLAEAGDIEGALALVREIDAAGPAGDPRRDPRGARGRRPHRRLARLRRHRASRSATRRCSPKDPATARAVLPKVAAAARAVGRCEGAGPDAGDRSPTSRPAPATSPAPWRRPGRSPT